MKSRIALLAGTALLAVAAAAAPASAAPRTVDVVVGEGPAACESGTACLYQNYNLNGTGPALVLRTDQNIPWLGDHGFNDITSSVCNFDDRTVVLFEHANYEGDDVAVPPGRCTNVPPSFNDLTSSVLFF